MTLQSRIELFAKADALVGTLELLASVRAGSLLPEEPRVDGWVVDNARQVRDMAKAAWEGGAASDRSTDSAPALGVQPRRGGKFRPKGEEPREVRSLRLTDTCWEALGAAADAHGWTRADLLEDLARRGALAVGLDQVDGAAGVAVDLADELDALQVDILGDERVTRGGKDRAVARRVLAAILERLRSVDSGRRPFRG
jgi:hypothetical protein